MERKNHVGTKVLAVLMCLMMIVTAVPLSAFAFNGAETGYGYNGMLIMDTDINGAPKWDGSGTQYMKWTDSNDYVKITYPGEIYVDMSETLESAGYYIDVEWHYGSNDQYRIHIFNTVWGGGNSNGFNNSVPSTASADYTTMVKMFPDYHVYANSLGSRIFVNDKIRDEVRRYFYIPSDGETNDAGNADLNIDLTYNENGLDYQSVVFRMQNGGNDSTVNNNKIYLVGTPAAVGTGRYITSNCNPAFGAAQKNKSGWKNEHNIDSKLKSKNNAESSFTEYNSNELCFYITIYDKHDLRETYEEALLFYNDNNNEEFINHIYEGNWAAFESALNNARTILTTREVTQTQIGTALAQLEATKVISSGHNFNGAPVSNGNSTHSYKCTRWDGCTAVGTIMQGYQNVGGSDLCQGGVATCTSPKICTVCNTGYDDMLPHELTAHAAKSATCLENGNIAYWYCSSCDQYFTDEYAENVIAQTATVIPATGHNMSPYISDKNATCEEDGTMTSHCMNPGCTFVEQPIKEVGSKKGHNFTAKDPKPEFAKTAPTCEHGGVYYYKCANCGISCKDRDEIPENQKTYEDNRVGPHTYTGSFTIITQATCTVDAVERAVCTVCGDVKDRYVPGTKGHTPGAQTEAPKFLLSTATCTEPTKYYYECSVCHEPCDNIGTNGIYNVGDPLGHSYSGEWEWADDNSSATLVLTCANDETHVIRQDVTASVESVAPLCNQPGSNTYSVSYTFDGTNYSDSKTVEVTTDDHQHVVPVPAVAATCKAAGNIAHYTCIDCNKLFSDAAATAELTAEDVVLPMLVNGHVIADPTVVDATCTNEGSQTGYCSVCETEATNVLPIDPENHKDAENNDSIVEVDAKDSTCTVKGNSAYSYCTECKKVYQNGVVVEGCTADNEDSFRRFDKPLSPNNHPEIELVPRKEPTCLEEGNKAYYVCTSCNKAFDRADGSGATQAEYKVLQKLQHRYTGNLQSLGNGTHAGTCVNGCNQPGTPVPCTLGNWVITKETSCKEPGSQERSCVCGYTVSEQIPALAHTEVSAENRVEPTCTLDGKEADIICSVCNKVISYGEVIYATGHQWDAGVVTKKANCVETGLKHFTCTVEGCTGEKDEILVIDPSVHKNVVAGTAIEPTCTEGGMTAGKYCDACNTQLEERAPTKPKGHTYVKVETVSEATCVAKEVAKFVCSVETCRQEKYEEIDLVNPNNHADLAIIPAVEATCGKDGREKGIECRACNNYCELGKIIPATGNHNYVSLNNAVAPTCENDGHESDSQCSVCGDIKLGVKIDKLEHNRLKRNGIPQTDCQQEGRTDEVYCDRCGEILEESRVLPKKEHTPQLKDNRIEPTCTEAGKEADYVCTVCGYLYQEGRVLNPTGHKPVSAENRVEPTCIEDGKESDTICSVCEITLEVGETIGKLGHRETSKYNGIPATCKQEGKEADTICSRCNELLEEGAVIEKLPHTPVLNPETAKDPTCSEEGQSADTVCSACGKTLISGEAIEKLPHTPGTPVKDTKSVIPATCIVPGVYQNVITCTVCTEELERYDVEIPCVPHQEVTIREVIGTCIEKGKTEGTVCRVCETVLVEPEDTDYGDHAIITLPDTPATCTEPGMTGKKYCRLCGLTIKEPEPIPPTGHSYVNKKMVKSATCTKEGLMEVQCKNCGEAESTQVIPPLGHRYQGEVTVKPTANREGVMKYTCQTCGHTYTESIPAKSGSTSKTPCDSPNANICRTYNKYVDTPILNFILGLFHSIHHLFKK